MVEGDCDMWVGLCERKKCWSRFLVWVPSLELKNQGHRLWDSED